MDYSDFKRLRCALLLEGEPDRVPIYGGVAKGIMSRFLGKPVSDLKTTVEFRAKAGYDYVPLAVDLWSTLKQGKKSAPAGKIKKGQYSIYANASDAGEETFWGNEGKGIITSIKEFEDFSWPRADDMDFSPFELLRGYMPREMKAAAAVGHIFPTVWTLMGMEEFCMALLENPSLVARMFETVGSIQYEVLDRVTRFESVGAVVVGDDIAYTTGLMISPKHLRKYLFPIFERMCALCKKRDLPVIYHSDGKIYDVLDDIAAAGFNGLHPIQADAMDIREVKKRVGEKLCLLGNIDLDMLSRGTPEQVAEQVKKNLREIAPGGGYCVGASRAEYVKWENYNAMRDTVLKYGTYPIKAQ